MVRRPSSCWTETTPRPPTGPAKTTMPARAASTGCPMAPGQVGAAVARPVRVLGRPERRRSTAGGGYNGHAVTVAAARPPSAPTGGARPGAPARRRAWQVATSASLRTAPPGERSRTPGSTARQPGTAPRRAAALVDGHDANASAAPTLATDVAARRRPLSSSLAPLGAPTKRIGRADARAAGTTRVRTSRRRPRSARGRRAYTLPASPRSPRGDFARSRTDTARLAQAVPDRRPGGPVPAGPGRRRDARVGPRPAPAATARPPSGGRADREVSPAMAVVTMRQLLESGVHFGHQTRRWNPKMKRFIFTERNGIYIIDLQQTLSYIDRAYEFVRETVAHGGTMLFVGTKKQAQEAIAEQAARVGMPYVNQRWLGGMLTNFQTVHKRLQRLKELESMEQTGGFEGRTKKEILMLTREKDKLEKTLGGIRDMAKVPERGLDRGHQEGAHRRRRGPQAGHPGRRHPRHQLRPGRGRLPDPGQRRRDPLGRAADQGDRRRRRRRPDGPLGPQRRRRRREAGGRAGADEPLAEWERELLPGGRRLGRRQPRRRGGPGRRAQRRRRAAPASASTASRRRELTPRPPGPDQPARRHAGGDRYQNGRRDAPWRTSPPPTSRSSATSPAPE